MDFNLQLPQGSVVIKNTKGSSFVTAVAGGRKPELDWLKQAANNSSIYCADKGLEACLDAGLMPQLLCGDADSTGKNYWQRAQKLQIPTLKFNPAKDDTDLQLLLTQLPQEQALLITGIWGGRFDHLFSNVYSLLAYKAKTGVPVIMADDKELMVLLQSGESLEFTPQQNLEALSLLPLADCCVSLSGVRWPLQRAELKQSRPYSISNEITAPVVQAACYNGYVGFYVITAGSSLL